MLVNNEYIIVTGFGKFEDIATAPEDFQYFNEACAKYEMSPAMFQEPNPNAPRNRIALLSEKQGRAFYIGSNRIDYINNVEKTNKEIKIDDLVSEVTSLFTLINDEYNKNFSRIGMYKRVAVKNLSSDQLDKLISKYSNPVTIYNEKQPHELAFRLNTRKEISIQDFTETVNVITSFEKIQFVNKNSAEVTYQDVVLLSFDINTVPEKDLSRFNAESLSSFVLEATKIQESIISEILSDI